MITANCIDLEQNGRTNVNDFVIQFQIMAGKAEHLKYVSDPQK